MTRLARSYGILVPEIMGYLSDCGTCRVVKAKSLKQMNVVMELGDGSFVWYVIGGVTAAGDDDDEDDDEGAPQQQQQYGDYEVGSADYYRHMSRGN